VEEILGNYAPAIRGFTEWGPRGGIKFAFASHHGQPVTFKSLYQSDNLNQEQLNQLLRKLFSEVLGRFSRPARFEKFDILKEYDFDGKGWAWKVGGSDNPTAVRNRIKQLINQESDILQFPGNIQVPSVAEFLEKYLTQIRTWSSNQQMWVGWVHGDLNGSNILIDENLNLWLIDFFLVKKILYTQRYWKDRNRNPLSIHIIGI